MGHILTSSLSLQQGLTPLDVARDRGHSDICKELEKYLTTETKETHYQEPESEIQKPDSEEHLTTESQEAPQQSHSGTTEPDTEEPLTTKSQEAHSLTQQSHSETTGQSLSSRQVLRRRLQKECSLRLRVTGVRYDCMATGSIQNCMCVTKASIDPHTTNYSVFSVCLFVCVTECESCDV